MKSIKDRCKHQRHMVAAVAPDTIDLIGDRLVGMLDGREIVKVERYIGRDNSPRVFTNLRFWSGGLLRSAVSRTPGKHFGVHLAGPGGRDILQGIGMHVSWRPGDTEAAVWERYHSTEWPREDIDVVRVTGFPGELGRDDCIEIESWNRHGVGEEVILRFEDVSPAQALFWEITGDTERERWFSEWFCTTHGQHYDDPEHHGEYQVCTTRPATAAENIAVLAVLAERAEVKP